MMTQNEFSMTFSADSINESFARSTVAGFCLRLDPTLEEMCDIKLAISEAVTNAVVHGYRTGKGEITIHTDIIDSTVHIRIIDHGQGILDVTQAMQPFFTTTQNEERSGMGFAVMQASMDQLTVYQTEGGGVTVEMTKKLGKDNVDA